MLRYIKCFYVFAVVASLLALAGCNSDKPVQAQGHQRPPVQVEAMEITTVPYRKTIELPGRISARRIAEVRARVSGIILTRDFEQGSEVKKGQVLFHIDPAPYKAALAQAKADLARAQANLVDLKVTADRYSKLIKTKSISQQEYDTTVTSYKAALASKDAAEAAVQTAELNLSYATVTAPISGRIGRAYVTEGALVGEGEATQLATIQQLDPIYADINQPVSDYLKLKSAMNKATNKDEEPEVSVTLEDLDYTAKGKLLFSDVTVNQDTNQVSLRSEFNNPQMMLLPGMYVRIRIRLGREEQVIFIPQRAVQLGNDGHAQVFVLDSENKVAARSVRMGEMETGGRWQITEGLTPGERIVVNGVAKVRDGMVVTVRQQAEDNVATNEAGTKE